MKKWIPMLLAFVLCLALSACGETNGTPTVDNGNIENPSVPSSGNTNIPTNTPTDPADPTQPAHTHTWVDATCTAPKTCTSCGTTEGRPNVHNYEETARIEPTKEKDGSITYKCGICGTIYTEVWPATGSSGLLYEENDDGTLTVVAIGTCTDTHVVIPDYFEGAKVTAIGKLAFYCAINITSVTIGDNVISIGEYAFYQCINLMNVNVGSNVSDISDPVSVFAGCSALNGFFVDKENATYSNDSHGVLYNKDMTILLAAPKTLSGSFAIPESVTTLAKYAFSACVRLTDVEISKSITSIPEAAFVGCSNLQNIILPDNISNIGDSAFYTCYKLENLNIPNGVTLIGESAFSCCTSLNNVSIPDSVITVGNSAFYGCSSLTNLTIGNSVTSIGECAFAGCSVLQSVDIPSSVISIGNSAFSGCSNLESVMIANGVTTIGNSAFYECSKLSNVTIPDSITTIGEKAFYQCMSLTSVIIPKNVVIIGNNTFYNCKNMTSVTIPDGVTKIENYAFCFCSSLTEIHYDGTIEEWNAIEKGDIWDQFSGSYTIYCTDGEIKK